MECKLLHVFLVALAFLVANVKVGATRFFDIKILDAKYVVQKDAATGQNKVTKVEGGGLSPNANINISDDTLDLLRMALKELKRDYNSKKIDELNSQLLAKENQSNKEQTDKELRYGLTGSQNSIEGEEGSIYFDFEEKQSSGNEKSVASEYKKIEFELNKAQVINLISAEGKNEQLRKDIAAELVFDGKLFRLILMNSVHLVKKMKKSFLLLSSQLLLL